MKDHDQMDHLLCMYMLVNGPVMWQDYKKKKKKSSENDRDVE